jgi:chromosome segregation ATPase
VRDTGQPSANDPAAADDPEATVRELGRAAAMAAAALAAVVTRADDETAFACVLALDEAFTRFAGVLSVLPQALELAPPGRTVSARLAQRQAELSAADIELTGLRTELDTLSEVEQGLRDAEAERELLTARLEDLTKARERAEQLPAVRERLAAFEAADTIARLTEGIRQLSALTDRQRMVLGAQLEQAITEMAAAGEALARQQARIKRLKADQARLEAESTALTESFGHELDALAKWRQADADLTNALDTARAPAAESNLDQLKGILIDLETRLADIDSRLRPVLEARARAREEALRVRNLSDHHAGLQG